MCVNFGCTCSQMVVSKKGGGGADRHTHKGTLHLYICVYCCHNQPKVGNDFFELISSSDAAEKELSSKSKIVFLGQLFHPQLHIF